MRLKVQLFILLAFTGLIIFSCSSSKKVMESSAVADPYKPGDAELTAIKGKFPEATSEQIADGYAVYTGQCTKCHGKKDIYSRSEEEWIKEINRMAPKAKITDEQKDHLTKYVFAMKAARPNGK